MKSLLIVWILLSASSQTEQTPEQIAHKRRHLARVVAELRARDTAHLSPSQRTARRAALAGLESYAAGGRFPTNARYPGWEVPYFIDDNGTRCALAQLIDNAGDKAIVRRLARQSNHAYVAGLATDRELVGWLRNSGLTLDEAAFIQGPGFVDPPPPSNNVPDLGPPPVTAPVAPRPETRDTPSADGPTSTPVPTAGRDNEFRRRRRSGTRSGAAAPGWDTWWRFNRHAYVNLRARYHDREDLFFGKQRPRRPSSLEFSRHVMPQILKLATMDKTLQPSALMAWARAGREEEREEAVNAIVAYLKQAKNQHRAMMLFALGVTRDEGGFDPLVDIMLDLPEGRAVLGTKGPIAEPLRAAAAIGLGAMGDRDAIEHLVAVLTNETQAKVDLRAAAVTSLGLLEPDAESVAFLAKALKAARWPRGVLAAVPTALGRAGETEAALDILTNFRGDAAVRQSCALALGAAGTELTLPVVETLEASALRDTDALVRRFAAIALAEIAMRHEGEVHPDALDRASRFYLGAQRRVSTQASDRPWHHLATALFAVRFPAEADKLIASLGKAARNDKSADSRAAATLAIGICAGREAPALLSRLRPKDPRSRAYLAEARGLANDKASLDSLVETALTDPSTFVRYHAVFGLGLLAEPAALTRLVRALETEKSAPAQAALARVIGEIGDRVAIKPLQKICERKGDTWNRRRALSALALIGQSSDHGWVQPFQRGQNFAAATPTLRLLLTLF